MRLSSNTWHPDVLYVFSFIGLFIGGFCTLFPRLSRPIHVGWHLFGRSMEFILSYSLLALFFFLILTPFGWLKRTLGHAGISKGPEKDCKTYWREVAKPKKLSQYYRQF